MLFQTCSKLTLCLFDILVITITERKSRKSVGSLLFRNRIFKFGKDMHQSLKRFLRNFNIMAI